MQHETTPGGRRRRMILPALMALAMVIPTGSTASAQAGCPNWTNDGSLIYCSGSGDVTELYEQRPDGSVRQLTYLGGQASAPTLSPDGLRIAFEVTYPSDPDPQVHVIDRFGPRARVVMVGTSIIELGHRAVMVGGTLVPIEAAHSERLTASGANYGPTFSPDGERISFTSDRLGVPSLWSMRVDGSDQREMLLALAD